MLHVDSVAVSILPESQASCEPKLIVLETYELYSRLISVVLERVCVFLPWEVGLGRAIPPNHTPYHTPEPYPESYPLKNTKKLARTVAFACDPWIAGSYRGLNFK